MLRGEFYRHDIEPSEVVDLASHWPQDIPSNGFELVNGVHFPKNYGGRESRTDTYLVERAGGHRRLNHLEPSLYIDFAHLGGDAEDIREFANKHGLLTGVPGHFHQPPDLVSASGESLSFWKEELECFSRTFELFKTAKNLKSAAKVKNLLTLSGAPWPDGEKGGESHRLQFPPPWVSTDPIVYAKAVVVETINYALAREHGQEPCGLPGCEFRGLKNGFDLTRAALGKAGRRPIALTTLAGTLRKTLWLQLACWVAGMRHLVPCRAADCKLGGWIDVTHAARPKARNYHPQCKERAKKQRKTERRKAAG
jgi:hypothetical protein